MVKLYGNDLQHDDIVQVVKMWTPIRNMTKYMPVKLMDSADVY
jgi:hypothetical protein